ncbi:MAG: S24 family peptidase [Acidobacteriota bacterium]
MPKDRAAAPEWSARILRLLDDLRITQAGLAERLGVSPATVSRWIQGKHEPTSEGYVLLGNLAVGPDCVYFWERAGVEMGKLTEGTGAAAIPASGPAAEVEILSAGRPAQTPANSANAVAIPLLSITAYGEPVPPSQQVRIAEAEVEDTLLAPPAWCPHPEQMIAMHMAGDSMMPLIGPDSILIVDRSETDRDKLNHRIVVASHRDLGFKVARFQRIGGTDLLVAPNHRYAPFEVTNAAKWKIFGEVLWWISRPASHAA